LFDVVVSTERIEDAVSPRWRLVRRPPPEPSDMVVTVRRATCPVSARQLTATIDLEAKRKAGIAKIAAAELYVNGMRATIEPGNTLPRVVWKPSAAGFYRIKLRLLDADQRFTWTPERLLIAGAPEYRALVTRPAETKNLRNRDIDTMMTRWEERLKDAGYATVNRQPLDGYQGEDLGTYQLVVLVGDQLHPKLTEALKTYDGVIMATTATCLQHLGVVKSAGKVNGNRYIGIPPVRSVVLAGDDVEMDTATLTGQPSRPVSPATPDQDPKRFVRFCLLAGTGLKGVDATIKTWPASIIYAGFATRLDRLNVKGVGAVDELLQVARQDLEKR
jgi:hypothetical protein